MVEKVESCCDGEAVMAARQKEYMREDDMFRAGTGVERFPSLRQFRGTFCRPPFTLLVTWMNEVFLLLFWNCRLVLGIPIEVR
jgi:hypothetical protein